MQSFSLSKGRDLNEAGKTTPKLKKSWHILFANSFVILISQKTASTDQKATNCKLISRLQMC